MTYNESVDGGGQRPIGDPAKAPLTAVSLLLHALPAMIAIQPKKPTRKPGTVIRGGREICRSDAAWEKRRQECHERAKGRCEQQILDGRASSYPCNRYAPLHGNARAQAGHAHHINGTRGLGGGKRDDSLDNLQWLCARCHAGLHQPAKVVPSKKGT